MGEVHLDWGAAQVRGAQLNVPLIGERPSGWKARFKHTISLLPRGEWGAVTVKKHAVRVADVAPGAEERLFHFLESVTVEANAASATRDTDGAHAPSVSRPDPDAEMTACFRGLARHEPSLSA